MPERIDAFLQVLRHAPEGPLFNPWFQADRENGLGEQGTEIRKAQLRAYLASRLGQARFLLIGEALGYQGGHFTGLAMTSERILLGYHRGRGIEPEDVLPGLEPRRTSKPALKPRGFTEPTATIVWEALAGSDAPPEAFVLWNCFAWHPYEPERGRLSNRKPRRAELQAGLPALKAILDLYPAARVIAVGKVAEGTLSSLSVSHDAVRHPAQGGATKFRRQFARILEG
jgi:hypothetical protein